MTLQTSSATTKRCAKCGREWPMNQQVCQCEMEEPETATLRACVAELERVVVIYKQSTEKWMREYEQMEEQRDEAIEARDISIKEMSAQARDACKFQARAERAEANAKLKLYRRILKSTCLRLADGDLDEWSIRSLAERIFCALFGVDYEASMNPEDEDPVRRRAHFAVFEGRDAVEAAFRELDQ